VQGMIVRGLPIGFVLVLSTQLAFGQGASDQDRPDAASQRSYTEVFYRRRRFEDPGYLYKPEGAGPFRSSFTITARVSGASATVSPGICRADAYSGRLCRPGPRTARLPAVRMDRRIRGVEATVSYGACNRRTDDVLAASIT